MWNNRHFFTCLLCFVISFPAFANIQWTGKVEQGGLIIAKVAPKSTVTLNEKPLTVSDDGFIAFGFGRDDENNYLLIVTDQQGGKQTQTFKPKVREYNIQRIEGIASKIMNPDPKAIARSKKDSEQVANARAKESTTVYFSDGFIAPIAGTITGVYGSQRVYNGVKKTPHFGLDYAGKTGDPVKAPADGVVTLFVPDMFYSGGTMIIDHGLGITSTFLHLSASYVKEGDKVKQGDVVAAVGASGRATGPHLDWRVNWFGERLDPALALIVDAAKLTQK